MLTYKPTCVAFLDGGVDMRNILAVTIVLLMLGTVLASGCMGGTSTGSQSSTTSAGSPSSTGTSGGTAGSHPSQSSPVTTTSTSVQSPPTSTVTSTSSETTTETAVTTSTGTPAQEYWENPWEYSPVVVNGEKYLVTYYKVLYKVRPNQSAPLYEYTVEKTLKKTKVHVYGTDMSGSTVDLGMKDVYEYTTVVTPIKAAWLKDKLVLTVWFTKENGDAFILPWNMGWMGQMSSAGFSGGDFVGMEMEYEGKKFLMTNPAPFKSGLFPHMEGSSEWTKYASQDLTNLYMGWIAVMQLGIWSAWSDKNLAVPQSGTWSDGLHSWDWQTKPDGTAEFSGVRLNLVDAEWKYSGSSGVLNLNGKSVFSPGLFLPLEVSGYFTYTDQSTGKPVDVYGYMKVEGLKLEKVS